MERRFEAGQRPATRKSGRREPRLLLLEQEQEDNRCAGTHHGGMSLLQRSQLFQKTANLYFQHIVRVIDPWCLPFRDFITDVKA